jgi:transposase
LVGGFEEHEEVIAMPCKTDVAALHTIGIDTGKNTLHMIDLDETGAIILHERVSRSRIAARLVNVPPCLIGIEAGMASHHVARELLALGHEVKQAPPAMPSRSAKDTRTTFGMRTTTRFVKSALRSMIAAPRPSTGRAWLQRRRLSPKSSCAGNDYSIASAAESAG